MSNEAEKQCDQCCPGGLSQQAGHSQHTTGSARTLRRSGRDNRTVIRCLEQSEACPTQHQTQNDTNIGRLRSQTGKREKPDGKQSHPDTSQDTGWMRSTRYPANGAVTSVANGHGVSRSPVMTSLCPKVFWRKKGKETIAVICAMKEQMEVRMDSRKIGIRSRSRGSSGVVCVSCRARSRYRPLPTQSVE